MAEDLKPFIPLNLLSSAHAPFLLLPMTGILVLLQNLCYQEHERKMMRFRVVRFEFKASTNHQIVRFFCLVIQEYSFLPCRFLLRNECVQSARHWGIQSAGKALPGKYTSHVSVFGIVHAMLTAVSDYFKCSVWIRCFSALHILYQLVIILPHHRNDIFDHFS